MSALAACTARMTGAKSIVLGGYDLSWITLRPAALALSRASSATVLANSASAAMTATVCGFGFCSTANAKKPSENAPGPRGPTATIEKYLGYLKCLLMPIAKRLMVVLSFCMMIGMAGATMLVAYGPSKASTLSTLINLV